MIPYYRTFRLSWYDHVWLALLAILSTVCIAIALVFYLTGSDLFGVVYEDDREALYASLLMVGIMGTGVVSVILLLLRDRREPGADRRQSRRAIDYPDRRGGTSRRSDS